MTSKQKIHCWCLQDLFKGKHLTAKENFLCVFFRLNIFIDINAIYVQNFSSCFYDIRLFILYMNSDNIMFLNLRVLSKCKSFNLINIQLCTTRNLFERGEKHGYCFLKNTQYCLIKLAR